MSATNWKGEIKLGPGTKQIGFWFTLLQSIILPQFLPPFLPNNHNLLKLGKKAMKKNWI